MQGWYYDLPSTPSQLISDFHLTQPIELRSLFSPQAGKEGDPHRSCICPIRALADQLNQSPQEGRGALSVSGPTASVALCHIEVSFAGW